MCLAELQVQILQYTSTFTVLGECNHAFTWYARIYYIQIQSSLSYLSFASSRGVDKNRLKASLRCADRVLLLKYILQSFANH